MSRRSKKQRRTKKQRKRQSTAKPCREGRTEATQALRRKLLAHGVAVVDPPPEAPKASDALVKLVEPILQGVAQDTGLNKERMESILRLGVLAWNAHALGYDSVLPLLEDHGAELDEAGELLYALLFDPILQRRRELFPDDPRLLGDFVVVPPSRPGGEFGISVAWGLPEATPAAS